MFRRLFRVLLTAAVLLLLSGGFTFLFLLWRINATGARDEARRADAIVVLGARVTPDGQAGADLSVRTRHGVELFQRGLAPYFVCTGGVHDDRLSAAAVACRLAVSQGVPEDKILLADGSSTTQEDAARTADLMYARGWSSIILVSHPLHLERARILFEAEGLSVYTSPTSTDLAVIPWESRAWLTAREAAGILWIYLADAGVPYEWTAPLNRWIYGRAAPSQAQD